MSDTVLIRLLGMSIQELHHTSQANALDGKPLAKIKEITESVTVLISGHYDEKIPLHLIATPQIPIILGYHWLVKHNPQIGWVSKTMLGWSTYSLSQCLSSVLPPCGDVKPLGEFPDLSAMSAKYLDLKPVFSKSHATIDLLSAASPPKGRLYSDSP